MGETKETIFREIAAASKPVPMSITVPPELKEKIKENAKENGVSVSFLIKQIVEMYFEHEDAITMLHKKTGKIVRIEDTKMKNPDYENK